MKLTNMKDKTYFSVQNSQPILTQKGMHQLPSASLSLLYKNSYAISILF